MAVSACTFTESVVLLSPELGRKKNRAWGGVGLGVSSFPL